MGELRIPKEQSNITSLLRAAGERRAVGQSLCKRIRGSTAALRIHRRICGSEVCAVPHNYIENSRQGFLRTSHGSPPSTNWRAACGRRDKPYFDCSQVRERTEPKRAY